MKTGAYEDKFVYYVLPFLLAGTYVKKYFIMSYANVITGHIGHFLVRMSRLTFAEGLFCYLFVYMSHTDVPTGSF